MRRYLHASLFLLPTLIGGFSENWPPLAGPLSAFFSGPQSVSQVIAGGWIHIVRAPRRSVARPTSVLLRPGAKWPRRFFFFEGGIKCHCFRQQSTIPRRKSHTGSTYNEQRGCGAATTQQARRWESVPARFGPAAPQEVPPRNKGAPLHTNQTTGASGTRIQGVWLIDSLSPAPKSRAEW